MPVPVFDFTTRAVPVVQMGRFQRLYRGRDRWGAARNAGWGAAKWGRGPGRSYEPVWADVTCDVHEVTTNTGAVLGVGPVRPGDRRDRRLERHRLG